jgi:hypothetical protein
MRNNSLLVFCLFGLVCQTVFGEEIFRTQTLSDKVKTLQVHSSQAWDVYPIIGLGRENQIEISFDILGSTPGYYTYRILHCNADWTPSPLVESEYITGIQNNYIDDYANSFNTKMDYVNYKLLVPNEKTGLKLSGNYVLQVISGDTNEPVLNACFSLLEEKANIQMQVSSLTDKGANSKFQAVSFEVNYGNEVRTPIQDLKVYVRQNNRYDNEAALVKPLNIQNRKVFYDHNPALIFDAGNEYRTFEMTNIRFNGLNVESIEYHSPYYHTILKPDIIRSNRFYSFFNDINGRIYINNIDVDDSEIEADYQFTHFYLPCEKPFPEDVYILSEAFNNALDFRSQMQYSDRDKGYVKTALLKEGYYNYLYVTRKNNFSPASTSLIEGNYYETENEYRVMVYFRPMGGRYDQLIGVKTLQYK